MLNKLKIIKENCEEGFTLIELLVVILIIGILAAIAIPVFLNQRQTANDGAVTSDVKNAVTQLETWVSGKKGATVELTQADLDSLSIKKSSSVIVQAAGNTNHFCVRAWHANAKKYTIAGGGGSPLVYDSIGGGLDKPCTVPGLSWRQVS